jgi:hypothetical protein
MAQEHLLGIHRLVFQKAISPFNPIMALTGLGDGGAGMACEVSGDGTQAAVQAPISQRGGRKLRQRPVGAVQLINKIFIGFHTKTYRPPDHSQGMKLSNTNPKM